MKRTADGRQYANYIRNTTFFILYSSIRHIHIYAHAHGRYISYAWIVYIIFQLTVCSQLWKENFLAFKMENYYNVWHYDLELRLWLMRFVIIIFIICFLTFILLSTRFTGMVMKNKEIYVYKWIANHQHFEHRLLFIIIVMFRHLIRIDNSNYWGGGEIEVIVL